MFKVYNLIVFLFLCSCNLSAQNISIVFRYDDFRLVNDSTNEKLVLLLHKYNIPVTLGVIPCDVNENFVMDKNYLFLDYLKKSVHNGSVEIALHGLNHNRMTSYGEFAGLSLEEQTRRIKKGKVLLDSVLNDNLKTFIPPWNSHDENTIKALKTNKIFIVSSSIYDVWSEEVYYPMSTEDYSLLELLVKNNQSFGGIIVVMLHPTDFKSTENFFNFEKILINLKKDNAITFYTFKGLESAGIYINGIQSEDQVRHNLLSKVLKLKGVFLSSRDIFFIKILNTMIYLIFMFFVYFIVQWIVLYKKKYNLIQYFILFLIALLITLSTWFFWWGPLKLAFVFGVIMIILPFVFKFFKVYNLTINVNLHKKSGVTYQSNNPN